MGVASKSFKNYKGFLDGKEYFQQKELYVP